MGKGKRVRICLKKLYDAEIEYLESTGTQYINTRVVGDSETRVRLVAASQNTSAFASMFGARQGADNRPSYCIWQYTSSVGGYGMRFDYNDPSNTSVTGSFAWRLNTTNEIIKDGSRNYVNGIEVDANADHTFTLAHPFFLFNVDTNGSPTAYPFIGSVYECQIWDSRDLPVRDFIPVRFTNENGQTEGALYDKVSKQLFRNKGTGSFLLGPDKRIINPPKKLFFASRKPYDSETGSFLLGPDKKNPEFKKPKTIYIGSKFTEPTAKSYIQDGLIHMYDSIENIGFGQFDPETTIWKDLVGDNHLNCMNVLFNGNWAVFSGNGMGVYTRYGYYINPTERTLECVYTAGNKFSNQYVTGFQMGAIIGSGNYLLVVPDRGWTSYPRYVNPNAENGVGVSIKYNSKSVTGGYVNGEKMTQSGNDYDIHTTVFGISIGASAGNNNTSSFSTMYKPFTGKVGCVRIYNRQLSEEEISYNYSIDKARFNLP